MKGLTLIVALALPSTLLAQQRPDLYQCEGCDAVLESPTHTLPWRTTIPPNGEPGERLVLSGIVYQSDGVTPAHNVIVYAYHTNAAGVYPTRGDEEGWGRRHGYLRGWIQTGADGQYRFDTIRPARYPGRSEPAHIHLIVKEPDRQEYWIEAVVFSDDPLLTREERNETNPRGGPGVVTPTRNREGTWIVMRDIVLEPRE